MIIGLTGERHVGKSTAAGFLEAAGFARCHPFDGGRYMSIAFFMHMGAGREEARRMASGDLKDMPSDLLPDRATPRYFMEHLGKFMGVTLGVPWTLGAELERAQRYQPGCNIVAESIVYEVDALRAAGAVIVRIIRDTDGPAGLHTDAAQAEIAADIVIENNDSLDFFRKRVLELIR